MDWDEISRTVIWAVLGISLLTAEMATATFILAFFGVAGLVTAGARLLGLDNFPIEVVVFAVTGAGGVFAFRRKIRQAFESKGSYHVDKEQRIPIREAIPAGQRGRVEYQGTDWDALNESSTDLQAGDTAVVVRTEGVKLVVKPAAK